MKKGLFALALGTFTLGIAEFIIEGILTDVAHNMNVSIPQAGHLISIYALGVCTGAFSLILMHKYRPKNILLFLTSLVILGAIIATIAPSYGLLLCARFIQGLPHGAYFGTATIVAVKMAKEGKGTKAVAMMCAGMPFANLLGVPLGTFLSHTISWRVPFLMSVALGVITLYMIYKWVPDVEALPNKGMKAQFRFMRHLAPWLIIAATFLDNGAVGIFAIGGDKNGVTRSGDSLLFDECADEARLYSATGALVASAQRANALSVAGLAKGIYVLKLTKGGAVRSLKVAIE